MRSANITNECYYINADIRKAQNSFAAAACAFQERSTERAMEGCDDLDEAIKAMQEALKEMKLLRRNISMYYEK